MTDREVVMEHINAITGEITSLVKRSYEQMSDFNNKVSVEAARVVEGGFGQAKELMELGMKTQKSMWAEWMKNTETARDMWHETVQNYSKTFSPKETVLKAAK